MEIFEISDFSVLDVENLRLHYTETLKHWLRQFEDHAEEIRSQFDEQFVRMWRLYLTGAAASFASGHLQLFQVLFANGSSNLVPRNRDYLYDDSTDGCDVERWSYS